MIDMVGIGPFIVIPLVIQDMNGPQALFAWIVGAFLAFVDGFIWSELGAAMPEAGGSYVFLREIYGPKSWGRLFSFLFIWQTIVQAPLVVASGSIGFSQYFSYLIPTTPIEQKLISGLLIIILVVLLYRKIQDVGKITLLLWVGVFGTIAWLIYGGATHFNYHLALDFSKISFDFSWLFFVALGSASVKTIYTYLGYYNVCHLGSEIKEPGKNIPRSIFISIGGIAVLYLLMNISVLGVVPWKEAAKSEFIMSTFMEKIYGSGAANIVTILILWIAFSSLFAVLLGYSRVPYAAAKDGLFFKAFGRVHPTKHFPHVSLLILGGLGFIFSMLFKLRDVISAILAMRIIVQFIGQAIGIMIIHKNRPKEFFPYKMLLYPIPALIAIFVWVGLFFSTGYYFALGGIGMMILGTIIFLVRAYKTGDWPFTNKSMPDLYQN
jgi:fructoselysine transporter